MSEWTYEYQNDGNGSFREWYNILRDGKVVGQSYDTEEMVKKFCEVLEAVGEDASDTPDMSELTAEAFRLLKKYVMPPNTFCRECNWRLDVGHMKECAYGNLLKKLRG